MSQENVELARRAWGAFGRAVEGGDLDPFLSEFVSRDFEYKPMEEAEVIRGRDGFARYMDRWRESWDDLRWVVEDVLDAGDDVLSVARMGGRAKETGIDLEMRYFMVSTVYDGKFVRSVEYLDRSEALAVVELRE